MARKNTILCFDDDDTIELLKVMFKLKNFTIKTVSTADLCLRHARKGDFSAIILDYKLPDKSGAELCREIREFDPLTPIIFFSACAYDKDCKIGLSAGAQAYLIKPNDIDRITDIVIRFIELRKKDPMGIGTAHKGCFLR